MGESAARGTEDKNEAGKQDRKQEPNRETRQKRVGGGAGNQTSERENNQIDKAERKQNRNKQS